MNGCSKENRWYARLIIWNPYMTLGGLGIICPNPVWSQELEVWSIKHFSIAPEPKYYNVFDIAIVFFSLKAFSMCFKTKLQTPVVG